MAWEEEKDKGGENEKGKDNVDENEDKRYSKWF